MSRSFHTQPRRTPAPIDAARLDALAIAYVGRYATTRAKLAAYLHRKLAVAGWDGAGEPPVAQIVARCATLGYVDDAAFASARAQALARRGFGARRVADALRAAGVEEEDAAPMREAARTDALHNALLFARRRRIGPYADIEPDRAGRRRALAAMMRAGHEPDIARRVIDASPGRFFDMY